MNRARRRSEARAAFIDTARFRSGIDDSVRVDPSRAWTSYRDTRGEVQTSAKTDVTAIIFGRLRGPAHVSANISTLLGSQVSAGSETVPADSSRWRSRFLG